jgi:hypothetical protein
MIFGLLPAAAITIGESILTGIMLPLDLFNYFCKVICFLTSKAIKSLVSAFI